MVTIRKYSNRRLYDTDASAYVNLEEIAERIRRGEQVRVVDAKTDEDLTRAVLMQILIEAPGALEMLPPALLHRIIRTGGGPMPELVAKQIAAGLELLETQLSAFEQQFGGWGRQQRAHAPPPPPPPAEGRGAPAADPELDALRQRLADLEGRLGGRR